MLNIFLCITKVDLIDMRSCSDHGYIVGLAIIRTTSVNFLSFGPRNKSVQQRQLDAWKDLFLHIWGCQSCYNQIMEKNLTTRLA